MTLAILAHVEADAGAFVSEELFGQGLGGFRFAGACGAREEKHALGLGCGGAAQAVHAGHGALHHVQRAFQRRALPLDALFKILPGMAQAVHGQGGPGVFPDAVFVQIHHLAQVADGGALLLAQAAHSVQLGEGQPLGQPDKLLPQPLQFLGVRLIKGHIRAVHRAVKEGGEGAAADQPLALLPVGGLQADGFAQGVVQVEPGGQVVELVHQQDQQILPPALGRAHRGGGQGRLQKQVEAVHILLIHPLRGDNVVAGQFQHGGCGRLPLAHGPADDVGRGVRPVALELGGNHAALGLHAGQTGIVIHTGGGVWIHEAHEIGIERYCVIPAVGQKAVQVFRQGRKLVNGDGASHGVAVLIQHIAFQNEQGLDGGKQLQLPVPLGNEGFHMRHLLFQGSMGLIIAQKSRSRNVRGPCRHQADYCTVPLWS